MKYNFFEELSKIKAEPYYELPENINKPIIDWLKSIKCKIGAVIVAEMQKRVNYGTVELVNKNVPSGKITIQVDAGMVYERKSFETRTEGDWVATITRTFKNPNLDKHRRKDNGKGQVEKSGN